MIFTFTEADYEAVGPVAWRRWYRNRLNNRRHEAGRKDFGIETDFLGVMTEYAVAMALKIPWTSDSDGLDTYRGDVGQFQIKSIPERWKRLIIRPQDPEDFIYILCFNDVYRREVEIIGWIHGVQGKIQEHLESCGHQPAYYIPKNRLRPIESLYEI